MKKKLFFLCLFGWFLIFQPGGNAIANIFFLSSKYQNEIIVEPLLLNKDDLINLLKGDLKKEISHSQVFASGINFVVRLKNKGNLGAWGTLTCKVEGYQNVLIYVPHLTPNMEEFVTFVIPLSGMITPRSTEKLPSLEIKWDKLYSK